MTSLSLRNLKDKDTTSSLKSFYQECFHFMHKKLYRKVYDEISSKMSLIVGPLFLDFLNLKINSCIKIIYKKLYKYDASKKKSLEYWLLNLETNTKLYRESIFSLEKNMIIDYIENFIQITAETLYLLALFNRKENNWADCITYLSIGYKILNIFLDNVVRPKTLEIFQKIIIFLSTIFIADNDFQEAINYQRKGLFICYRQLFLSIDIQKGLEINIQSMIDSLQKENSTINKEYIYRFERLIVNIVTLLFHQGLCLESLGLLTEALFNYSQARFFTERYISTLYSEFLEFIENIESRLRSYKEIIIKIREHNVLIDENNLNIKDSKAIKAEINKISNKSYEAVKIRIEDLINKLRLEDLKDIELFSKRDNLSKNVIEMSRDNKLLSIMLSKDFSDALLKLNNTNTTKFNSHDFHLIQKKLANLRNENLIKLIDKSGNNVNNNMINTIQENETDRNKDGNSIIDNVCSIASPRHEENKKEVFKKIKIQQVKDKPKQTKLFKIKRRTSDGDEEIQKFNHSNYILSKNYRKKYSLLESSSYKDNQFHKSVLNLKKEEIIPNVIFTKDQINSQAKDFFDVNIRSKKIIIDELKDKSNLNKTKDKLEQIAIKSLNCSKLIKYNKEQEENENHSYYKQLINKFKNKTVIEFGKEIYSSSILNNKIEDIINKEIKEINKYISIEKSKFKKDSTFDSKHARSVSTYATGASFIQRTNKRKSSVLDN